MIETKKIVDNGTLKHNFIDGKTLIEHYVYKGKRYVVTSEELKED